MRATITALLRQAQREVPIERIFQIGSVEKKPETLFIVYRLSGDFPTVTRRSPARRVSLEIWVHDQPGDYSRIDGILKQIEATFDAVVHASAAEGEWVSTADFESRSPDLNDDGFGTICKMTNYSLIGRG